MCDCSERYRYTFDWGHCVRRMRFLHRFGKLWKSCWRRVIFFTKIWRLTIDMLILSFSL